MNEHYSDPVTFWISAAFLALFIALITFGIAYEVGKKHGIKETQRETFEFEDITYNQEVLEELELQVKHQKEHVQRLKGEKL
jgi:hypothetical protein